MSYQPKHHVVTPVDTQYVIHSADGTLIYGTCPAGCNISTGQDVMEVIDVEENYYTRLREFAVPWELLIGTIIKTSDHPVIHNGILYEPIQQHTVQSDWTPDIVPALFKKLHEPAAGEAYPVWVQPTGAHDAYQMGDRVLFNDLVYESKINANVWSPTGYPAGWILID